MENDQPLLSVIVPVYNTAPWLPACLRSIAEQTLPSRYVEVILVDDASTDGSVEICREFCSRYENFRCIEFAEHTPGGAGTLINRALEQAQGAYIGMVDSDDFIEPDMFALVLHRARETGADMVFFNYRVWYEQEQRYAPAPDQEFWQMLCRAERAGAPLRQLQQKALRVVAGRWRKIYRREFLEAFHIRYLEGDFSLADNVLHWHCIVQARSITTVDRALLTYRIGRAGQITGGNPDKLAMFISEHARRIQEFLIRIHHYETFKREFFCWYLDSSRWLLPNMKTGRRAYLHQLQQRCHDVDWAQLQACRQAGGWGLGTMIQCWFMLRGFWRTGWLAGWCVIRAGRFHKLWKKALQQKRRQPRS